MIVEITVGFVGGVVATRMLGAWFARESAAVKATILTEVAKVTPDVEKIKALVAKL